MDCVQTMGMVGRRSWLRTDDGDAGGGGCNGLYTGEGDGGGRVVGCVETMGMFWAGVGGGGLVGCVQMGMSGNVGFYR